MSPKIDPPKVDPTKVVKEDSTLPVPVLVAAEQPPIPMMQIAPDGVTPVPIATLSDAANTPPGESTPVGGASTSKSIPGAMSQSTTTTTSRPTRPDVVKGEGATLAPTTTEQQDLTTSGQRAINRIWEYTQSGIALMVVVSGVLVNSAIVFFVIFNNREVSTTQLSLISISLQFINLTTGIIIGFYFSRTNHSAQGGIGPKVADAPYTGR